MAYVAPELTLIGHAAGVVLQKIGSKNEPTLPMATNQLADTEW